MSSIRISSHSKIESKSFLLLLLNIIYLFYCYCVVAKDSQLLDCTKYTDSSISRSECSKFLENNLDLSSNEGKSVDGDDDCEKSANANWTKPTVVCAPRKQENGSQRGEGGGEGKPKLVEVFIRSPNDSTRFEIGSQLTFECRFNVSISSQDLKFKLRWLRSVVGRPDNQSISTHNDSNSPSPLSIVDGTVRVWTVQRDGGLDLELSDFQPQDAGSYFCQVVSLDSPYSILSESVVRIDLTETIGDSRDSIQSSILSAREKADSDLSFISRENLSKLLPSLKVLPQFREAEIGEIIQFVCITSEVYEPLPRSQDVEWSFESVGQTRELMSESPIASAKLPANVTTVGNTLMVWSASAENCGFYKCRIPKLSSKLGRPVPSSGAIVEAVGELAIRPEGGDSAPFVFVSPEVIRLSSNGAATIQCESTGYPPPELTWYRVDSPQSLASRVSNSPTMESSTASASATGMTTSTDFLGDSNQHDLATDEQIEVERVAYKDAMFYCRHYGGCATLKGGRGAAERVTAISLVHLREAKAKHQGQYVCRASNKHGSNQASAVIDVEFNEPPMVRVAPESSAIVVRNDDIVDGDEKKENEDAGGFQQVTFRCSVESGRPTPKLRWLRVAASWPRRQLSGGDSNISARSKNSLDIYDLTKVSTATSNVSTWAEDNGKTLVLSISTVSPEDEGDYACVGENAWGRHSSVAHLAIRRPASVKIAQSSPKIARINESFTLECLSSGHPLPMDIEWSRPDRGTFFSLISRTTGGLSNSRGVHERAVLKFDRVGVEESGEYTCNARDPLDPSLVLKDKITVIVDGGFSDQSSSSSSTTANESSGSRERNKLLPKLLVRPTRVEAKLGSNLTLDCLAVSGLQPTLVEWLAPTPPLDQTDGGNSSSGSQAIAGGGGGGNSIVAVRRYYRDYYDASGVEQLLQFGSKIRILNVSKAHEGVYQCKGSNRVGAENAPALIKVLDVEESPTDSPVSSHESDSAADARRRLSQPSSLDAGERAPAGGNDETKGKTKVAKVGSNIELICQVNGVEPQPATSWSRDGLELPQTSVQIGHNLWIRNVTEDDNGLYVCSARSLQPNKVIQARINLLVRVGSSDHSVRPASVLTAKVVASKASVVVGDSITLECIISAAGSNATAAGSQVDLDELERNVVWTNLHLGQSLFQENVYVKSNLLIIYELRPENSATYRCHYNDLTQHADYKLHMSGQTGDFSGSANSTGSTLVSSLSSNQWAELRQVSLGSRLTLECPQQQTVGRHVKVSWTRRGSQVVVNGGKHESTLVFESVQTSDADLYQCYHISNSNSTTTTTNSPPVSRWSFIVQVLTPAKRFLQRPVSFAVLPSKSVANHELEIELKFFPERDYGLILFEGPNLSGSRGESANSSNNVGSNSSNSQQQVVRDYISLGLNQGYLDFRFDLGDGTTLVRSARPVAKNQWHRVAIVRNRRGATMWIDGEAPVSNTSTGKFYFLNLDSVLFIGGHQFFAANARSTADQALSNNSAKFNGYARGFQGCISLLKISGDEINLLALNRSASTGLYECDRSECGGGDCSHPNGVCQVDAGRAGKWWTRSPYSATADRLPADLRCICLPNIAGERCDHAVPARPQVFALATMTMTTTTTTTTTEKPKAATQPPGGACGPLSPCAANGTFTCQSLSSSSYKCHCSLGFTGATCASPVAFPPGESTSVGLNEQGYLHLAFNSVEDAIRIHEQQQTQVSDASSPERPRVSPLNATTLERMLSVVADQLNLTFSLQTRSSYAVVLYLGDPIARASSQPAARQLGHLQSSKSMAANLLSRLSAGGDFLAVSLVDGYLELNLELGSGVAVIRSSERVNDGETHLVQISRVGRWARLAVDLTHAHEGKSPGKLSKLNVDSLDVFIGGLADSIDSLGAGHLMLANGGGFVGCLRDLEVNSLGPLTLVRSDHLTLVRSARNLTPCRLLQQQQQHHQPPAPNVSQRRVEGGGASKGPPKPHVPSPAVDSDDPDEM